MSQEERAAKEGRHPKVSVCVITYNQVRYIRQCLESIVNQRTAFDFEVLVGDDCSNDGTDAIVREFGDRYPRLVTPILRPRHIGGTQNLLRVYAQAKGELIAHMDGDDYMLPEKLAIQAQELDRNSDCSMCVHAIRQFDEATSRYQTRSAHAFPRKGDLAFLLMHFPYFAHSSKMFRAECHDGLDAGVGEMLDCYFHVHHASRGKILYLPQLLGVYRVKAGMSTVSGPVMSPFRVPTPGMLELTIEAIEYAGRLGVAGELSVRAKAQTYFSYAYAHLIAGDSKTFQMLIKRSCETARLNGAQTFFDRCSAAPGVLSLLVRIRTWARRLLAARA